MEKIVTTKKWRYLLMLVISIIIISTMIYSFYSSNQMINKYAPLIDAAMEVKFESARAHLWLEEILTGDRHENIQDIIKHIDQAIWYAKVMLEGGKNKEGTFIAISDLIQRKEVAQVIKQIKKFKLLSLKRFEDKKLSGIGTSIDQQYDSLFKNFINEIDNVETFLQKKSLESYSRYQKIQITLILVIFILSSIGFYIQYFLDQRQKKYIFRINEARDIARKNEQWLKTTMNSMGDGVIITDHIGIVTYLNPVASSLTGWHLDDAKNRKILEIFNIVNEQTKEPVENPVMKVIKRNIVFGLANHTELISKDGKIWPISDSAAPIFDNDNNLIGVVIVFNEMSEQKKVQDEKIKLEKKLVQAQKMESIGTLAGGIAHDFNNILGVILGYTELSLNKINDDKELKDNLKRVMGASRRAKDMVKQILAFSRKDETEMEPVLIKEIIRETEKFLRASIPSTISINIDIKKNTGKVLANSTQINQILMNLCTNAAHAMKNDGGTLEISLRDIEMDRENVFDDLKPGRYQLLQIKDSGTGIDKDTVKKIFDPYFTTKEIGEGTGMGLSVVYGIIRKYGGFINVYSEPGKGTVFNVYLPLMIDEDLKKSETSEQMIIKGGDESILFVDDERELAELGVKMLSKLGYQVEFKSRSKEALDVFKSNPEKFDVIVTDMTMPYMTGAKLAGEVHKIKPDIPVILCTGFSNGINKENYKSKGISAMVMKPIVRSDLAEAIREVLDKKK